MKTYSIHEKTIHIWTSGNGIPYVYLGVQENSVDYVEKLVSFLKQNVDNLSITLIAYEAKDWNTEFSPWRASSAFGGNGEENGFAGKGEQTLEWLQEKCIPFVEKIADHDLKKGKNNRYLAGYSLAGLFSLWGFYESHIFRGCVSGSGSLWYSGWKEYLEKTSAPEDGRIYLSLGGKEEKTRNPIMASIGNVTRETKKWIETDKNIAWSKLEWNPGGHFAETEIRMAKGIMWLLEKHHR